MLWGPNAAQFDLAKWFDEEGRLVKEPNSFVFPVFNAGPRTCLGKSMALLESSMLLFQLIQQFKFTLCPHQKQVIYGMTVTLPIQGGLKVNVEQREG
jgi:cytochrome P450